MIKLILVVGLCVFAVVATGQGQLVGAPSNVDPNSESVRRALSFALNEYNKATNDLYASKVLKVNSARRQIVSGVNYIFNVDLTRTTCRKPTTDLQNCDSHSDPALSKTVNCLFKVYNVPWTGVTRVTKSTCS